MANATRERKLKETFIAVTGSDGLIYLIDDLRLIEAYYSTDMNEDTVIELQRDRRKADLNLKAALEDSAVSAEIIRNCCVELGLEDEESLEQIVRSLATIVKGLKPEEIVALRRLFRGERPTYSTGIHGGLTCGYGKLDALGFWEFPLPPMFPAAAERSLRIAQNAEILEAQMHVVLQWLQNDALGKPLGNGWQLRVNEVVETMLKVERNKPS